MAATLSVIRLVSQCGGVLLRQASLSQQLSATKKIRPLCVFASRPICPRACPGSDTTTAEPSPKRSQVGSATRRGFFGCHPTRRAAEHDAVRKGVFAANVDVAEDTAGALAGGEQTGDYLGAFVDHVGISVDAKPRRGHAEH